jgi:hypothetical protein
MATNPRPVEVIARILTLTEWSNRRAAGVSAAGVL